MGDLEPRSGQKLSLGLRDGLLNHRSVLIAQLDANTLFLTYLAKYRIIDPGEILKFENYGDDQKRNTDLLDGIVRREPAIDEAVPDAAEGYTKFLEALKKSGQDHLAAMMTNVNREIEIVDQYQDELGTHLDDINGYLVKESRRAQIKFKPSTNEERSLQLHSSAQDDKKESLTDFLYKVTKTTKSTLVKFDRCKEVIEKLHADCDAVAKKNADMLSKLRECESCVIEMIPAQAEAMVLEEYARPETGRGRGGVSSRSDFTPRSKDSEAELIMSTIRQYLTRLGDYLKQSEVDHDNCLSIIRKMTEELHERKVVLGKAAEAPPTAHRNKYVETLPPIQHSRVPKAHAFLRPKLELFADELQSYVQHETQVTHKMNVNKYQAGLAHRQFDQVDGDLGLLQRELRRNDKERAMALAKHIVEVTKAERNDCLKMVEEVENTVRTRRQKIQEIVQHEKMRSRRRRPQFQRVRFTRAVDSNFSKRLNDLNNEVKLYIDLEQEQFVSTKGELAKRKVEYDGHLRNKTNEIKTLERKLKDITTDRDKYRIMYNKEKNVVKVKMITKPTIPRRDLKALPPIPPAENQGQDPGQGQSLPTRRPLRRVGAVSTLNGSRPVGTTSRLSAQSGMGRVSVVRSKPIARVKPRLTPRAKDLKGLKENIKGKKRQGSVKPFSAVTEPLAEEI